MEVSKEYLKILLIANNIVDNPTSDFWCQKYYEIEEYCLMQKEEILPEEYYKNTLLKMSGIKGDKWKHLRLRKDFTDFISNKDITSDILDKWESQVRKYIKSKDNVSSASKWFIGVISNDELISSL